MVVALLVPFLASLCLWIALALAKPLPTDPCAVIAGKKWVLPHEALKCMRSFPVDPAVKANIIEVVNKTLAFHTSVNYQIQAPPPFDSDVHEDLVADLARINNQTYPSDFDLHLDIYRSFKRVNDGHCGVYNYCYDSLYVTYIPLPLVLLTERDGSQFVHIAPEAFDVAQNEFGDEVEFWQEALPGKLKGKLASLSGARVLSINDEDPFKAVDANTAITGGYQSFATRQNAFFASYSRGAQGWQYLMGNFAQQVHPLTDSVTLTVQRVGRTANDTFTIPYRSRFGSIGKNFTDSVSYRVNNCRATAGTNGIDLYDMEAMHIQASTPPSISYFQQQPQLSIQDDDWKQPVNVLLDGAPLSDVDLPEKLQPKIPALNESYSVAHFYLLDDKRTGVLALGSFSAKNFTHFGLSLLDGLRKLRDDGAERLIVDVTNNGGGYICIAHWLHRIIIGPKETTEPQAGLDTTLRAHSLAQLIVSQIANGSDPDELLLYNPTQWNNASHERIPSARWLKPHNLTINGHVDSFSQRLGQECQPFPWEPPARPLFVPENVLIVSNGRCASSCSLFSITMAKEEGVRTVVVGGKDDIQQDYCGTVGGQSTSFSTIDTEIKTTKLKNHSLAPPDFISNSIQGITWRLGYGIDDPETPEEWQPHPADITLPLTPDLVNNPVAIWEHLADQYFETPETPVLHVQTLLLKP